MSDVHAATEQQNQQSSAVHWGQDPQQSQSSALQRTRGSLRETALWHDGLGTEKRLRKQSLRAHSYLLSASATGLWGDHSGGVDGQRLPCGVLSLRGKQPAPWPTAQQGSAQNQRPLSRCRTHAAGALAGSRMAGRVGSAPQLLEAGRGVSAGWAAGEAAIAGTKLVSLFLPQCINFKSWVWLFGLNFLNTSRWRESKEWMPDLFFPSSLDTACVALIWDLNSHSLRRGRPSLAFCCRLGTAITCRYPHGV